MISTKDIRFRAIEPEDVSAMYDIENDESAWQYSDSCAPLSYNLLMDYAANYEANPWHAGQLRLIIEVMDSNNISIAGVLDFFDISPKQRHAKVGIYIIPEMRKKGIATLALQKCILYGFENIGLTSMIAEVKEWHLAARRAFQNAGWRECGLIPEWMDGVDTIIYQASKKCTII